MAELPPTEAFPWPPKAYKNKTFLDSNPARNIRVLCELTEPAIRLEQHNIRDTIVLFGSARTQHPEQAKARLAAAESACAAKSQPSKLELRELAIARAGMKSAPYYQAAMDLSERLTRWSRALKLPKHKFVVCSGGGPGMMEAANRGAHLAGGESIGFGISLPFEQSLNPYITRELQFEFHYFFIRKYWFMLMAKALIALPGGFGTLDELFESLTLIQTQKVRKHMPIVLFGGEFWNKLIHFETLIEWGMISEQDLHLFRIIDSVDEAAGFVISELEKQFV
jgi:uncharacterized protein (TIGR00730 family)